MCDVFFQGFECDIATYVDNNTPLTNNYDIDTILEN